MSALLRLREIECAALAIPMRVTFEHAAASRSVADPIVVRASAEAPRAGLDGYGETLARGYVTGEDAASVTRDVLEFFAPALAELRVASFAEALEFVDALPRVSGSRVLNAARCAVELAMIDLAGKAFSRRAADAASWLELPSFGSPGGLETARYSGIVVGDGWKARAAIRAQRCYGLRDYKIKVAIPGWETRLRTAAKMLRSAMQRGAATLRADANGGWSLDEALAAIPILRECGVTALEQPLRPDQDDQLARLRDAGAPDLIADESLVTADDAKRLIASGAVRVFNIRLAKNGGLMPSLHMAHAVLAAGKDVQLGCLVGESSLLSAAGIAFLECCPRVRFVEGAFGRFLLRDDVVPQPVQFGAGGVIRRRGGFGLAVDVDPFAIKRLATSVRSLRF
ncbi:MAG: enolase C-terminal domain-like protein [Phycisphaerae bacterium]